jgi:DNA-directed RNA polymerase specialized sigma24 family protein
MREIDRMSYKDIADTLQKNLSTVKSQIRNGRHLLIEQSKEFEENEMYL